MGAQNVGAVVPGLDYVTILNDVPFQVYAILSFAQNLKQCRKIQFAKQVFRPVVCRNILM